MNRIPVIDGHEVVFAAGATARLGELLDELDVDRPVSVVTNSTVAPLHGARAASAIGAVPPFELPDGEAYKRWAEVERVCAGWLERGVHRGQTVMAVGGGVVTDTVGFAAAVYLRGIPWLALPTTLLAIVDAAVGGKTGVNLEQGKNLVGCFWPPSVVVVDVTTLATLPERELRAGVVEAIKAAWIGDHQLLDLLDRPLEGFSALRAEDWEAVVVRAVRVKAKVVRADLREGGPRKALNLGHTLGHAIESATGYERFLHGEAVAWGMRAAARIARGRDLLSPAAERRLTAAIDRLGPLPTLDDLDADTVVGHISVDKKRDDEGVGWVLPTDDGVVLDQRVTTDEIRQVFVDLQRDPS
jgi:3-dehydroquinate synthase